MSALGGSLTRVDWSAVTLAEYASLAVIRRSDAVALLDAHWDDVHAHNPFRGDTPTRLTDDGRAWLAGLHELVTTTDDEHAVIGAAREFLASMGTLTVIGADRIGRAR